MSNIRVLLVESDLDRTAFVQDALYEAAESAAPGDWTGFQVTALREAADAEDALASGEFDVVLLNPTLMDRPAHQTMASLGSFATRYPFVLLIEAHEETACRRFLRDGIQDYLVWSELDCKPLIRALRNAIERHKRAVAIAAGSVLDELTKLLNRSGFEINARREFALAEAAGQRLALVLAEVDSFDEVLAEYGPLHANLALVDAACVLRDATEGAALLGRLDHNRLAALVWRQSAQSVIGRIQHTLGEAHQTFAFVFGWYESTPGSGATYESALASAMAVLCENKHADPVSA
jgi:PleD family two-component response regulator